MLKLPPALRTRNALVTVLGVVLIAGTTTVVAQTAPMEPIQWDKRRLEQLDRNVRRLERAVTQRNAAGQPVDWQDAAALPERAKPTAGELVLDVQAEPEKLLPATV